MLLKDSSALITTNSSNGIASEQSLPLLGAALTAAALGGSVPAVVALLNKGADANAADEEGGTALIAAAVGGHVEVAASLLAAGAVVNHEGRSKGWSALCVAAARGRLDVVSLLLKANADINHRTNDDSTPLILAAEAGQAEVVQLLLRQVSCEENKCVLHQFHLWPLV
jgi:ankyrin repeat protein